MAEAAELRHLVAGRPAGSALSGGATVDLFAGVRRAGVALDADPFGGGGAARWRPADEAARQLSHTLTKASLADSIATGNGCLGGGDGWGSAGSVSSAGSALDTLALLGSLGLSDAATGSGHTTSHSTGHAGGWPERPAGTGSAPPAFDAQSECVLNAAAQLMRSSEQQISRHSSDSGHSSGTRSVQSAALAAGALRSAPY